MPNLVQLTVGTATRLLLNVTRDFNSTRHVFNCRLLHGSSGVSDRVVKLKLNQTEYGNTTDADGLAQFVLWLSPQAENNQTNYNVVASFEGDVTSLATASFTLPNGTQYNICTTIQYDSFKPSSNSTSITVRPQTTEGATTLISQEQLEADARANGQLRTEPRFSLGYPWLRLHFILAFDAKDVLDVGLSLIGDDIIVPYNSFFTWLNNFIGVFAKPIAISYIATEVAVWAAMNFGPPAFAISLLASIGIKAVLLYLAWNYVDDLKSAFIGAWVSMILGAVGVIKMLHSGLVSLACGFLTAVKAVAFWKFLYRFIYIPVNLLFLILTLNRLSALGGI